MTLRFASLGSGSRGNAVLVESDSTLVMVDCGFTLKAVEQRLNNLDKNPKDIQALLVTHEHSDHIKGVPPFVRQYGIPAWMTHGTAESLTAENLTNICKFNCEQTLTIGSLTVQPFPVPHDAREPVQFIFSSEHRKLGMLTDTGHITPHIAERLANCDALAIECNHDAETLLNGAYPETLKARISSSYGHLNNDQVVGLLEIVNHEALQWVMALHLSEKNNSPDLVCKALAKSLAPQSQALHIAEQNQPSEWIEVA